MQEFEEWLITNGLKERSAQNYVTWVRKTDRLKYDVDQLDKTHLNEVYEELILKHHLSIKEAKDIKLALNKYIEFKTKKFLNSIELQQDLLDLGFKMEKETKKVDTFSHAQLEYPWCVKKSSSKDNGLMLLNSLTIAPNYMLKKEEILKVCPEISSSWLPNHHTGLTSFQKKQNKGKNRIYYGLSINVPSTVTLKKLLNWMMDNHIPSSTVLTKEDIELETEIESLVKLRKGQNKYRLGLIEKWKGCSVTGYQDPKLLIASHIKPWRSCTVEEKLNPNNGLLLIPTLDKLFDQGFISFDLKGQIMISSALSTPTLLGVQTDMKLIKIDKEILPFLEWHQQYIFRGIK